MGGWFGGGLVLVGGGFFEGLVWWGVGFEGGRGDVGFQEISILLGIRMYP